MKRIVALLLCLVMGAAMLALAACPAQDTPTPAPEPEPGKSTYTVTFEGDGVTTPAQTVAAGGTAIRPRDPEKEGYAFEGWFAPGAETPFDFATPITADIVLTAHFHRDLQNGTAENPYRIASVSDLLAYVEKINHPEEEGNEDYRTAHYLLTADLDMTGVAFQPIGRSVTLREGEKDEVTLSGFAGYFDGGGHTIRNLTVTRALRQGTYYVGFFGEADRACIHDLTLENIAYGAESGGNVDTIGLYMGGLVGHANLTTIRNVTVSGKLTPALCEKNRAFIGGMCGGYEAAARDGNAYITYLENCLTDVTIEPGRFSDDDSAGVFASAVVAGGFFGEGYGYGSTAAILNCAARGKVTGGRAAGGIAGQVTGNWFSFVNCASSVSVSAVATDVTYAGGIAGYMAGDHTVMDCLSLGRVKGTKAPVSSTYKSMAGGIVGFAEEDDYLLYYTAGVAIVNCHYKNNISTYDVKNQSGTALDGAFNAAFAADTLRWGADMTVDADGGAVTPAKKTDAPRTVRLTTKDGESVIASTERETGNGTVALVGAQDDLPHGDGRLFFDWGFTADVRYRSYVPLVKDVTLVAQWGDADALAASYTGTFFLYDTKDAGTLALYRNGTLEWFTSSSTVRGRYTTDGTHILFTFFNSYGDVSGTCEGGTLTYSISAGMSGDVAYTMKKNPSLAFIGEYYSAEGDTLTFTGENSFSFRAENVNGGRTMAGTYTRSGSTLTFSATALSDLYTAATATVDADGNLSLHFHPKAGAPEYDGTAFTKIGVPDYTGKAILGEYRCSYATHGEKGSDASQSDYTVFFNADGTVVYRSQYSDNTGSYFLFKNDTYVVLTLDGNTSIFHFDPETRTVYGLFDRGVTAKYPAIHTPAEYGDQKVFVLDNGTGDVLVAAGTHRYLLRGAAPVADASITAADVSDGARVTVEGKDYFTKYDERGYRLLPIGAEEGTYTASGATYTLDGIGHVSGTKKGEYRVYGTKVILVFDDNSAISFDYAAAKAASGAFTALTPDGLGGVWFLGGNYTVENEDGEEEKIFDPERYKLVVDGFGYVAFFYRSDPTSEYRHNWGSSGWVPYTTTVAGIYAEFNAYQKADILFYYDRGLAYSKSFGHVMGEVSLTAPGYTGAKTPPALPAALPGKYTGTTADGTAVVFNLLSDLTGSYAGRSFSGVWDGGHRFLFSIGGVNYVWDTESMILSYGTEAVKLTAAGAVTEVIPAGLCGIWSGTWSGMGMGASGQVQTIEIRTDGTVIYSNIATFTDAHYDVATGCITAEIATDDESIVITIDAATGKASAVYRYKYDESDYQHECRNLTLQAQE